jgi:hypothetical protein
MSPLRASLIIFGVACTGCGARHDPPRVLYEPLASVEARYGALITAGNHPTLHQNGTGERVGLFKDGKGTVWGLPMTISGSGEILACAPPSMRDSKVTDTFPEGSVIIGATNEPTGWRGGTGDLELLLRDKHGTVLRQLVHGAQLASGPVCWAPEFPGPPQQLLYFRLESKASTP